jgi:hypothetical protein
VVTDLNTPCPGRSGEPQRHLARLPNHGFEEVFEPGGIVDGLELEINDDVLVVIDWLVDALRQHTRLPSCVREAVEGGEPSSKVGDRVLDVECSHPVPPGRAQRLYEKPLNVAFQNGR